MSDEEWIAAATDAELKEELAFIHGEIQWADQQRSWERKLAHEVLRREKAREAARLHLGHDNRSVAAFLKVESALKKLRGPK